MECYFSHTLWDFQALPPSLLPSYMYDALNMGMHSSQDKPLYIQVGGGLRVHENHPSHVILLNLRNNRLKIKTPWKLLRIFFLLVKILVFPCHISRYDWIHGYMDKLQQIELNDSTSYHTLHEVIIVTTHLSMVTLHAYNMACAHKKWSFTTIVICTRYEDGPHSLSTINVMGHPSGQEVIHTLHQHQSSHYILVKMS